MISKYDKIIVGFAVSLVVAFVVYALLLQAQDLVGDQVGRVITFNERTIALMAICLNVIPMNYFRRKYHNQSLRGLVIGTMVLAGMWFYRYGQDLLNNG